MTKPLAGDEPHVLAAPTIGAAWVGAVELVVYAHSIDFGAKGYGNLVELASLQHHVAGRLGVLVGRLVMIVKSAHVYQTEETYVRGILAG